MRFSMKHSKRIYSTQAQPLPKPTPEDVERFWSKVDKGAPNECWEWTGYTNEDGYGGFSYDTSSHGPGRHSFQSHRFAYFVNTEINPGKNLVLHTCDNPPCCNPDHLFLGTAKDNIEDCVRKGRHVPTGSPGETNPKAKLTEAQVQLIREMNGSQRAIAKCFGVAKFTVQRIRSGAGWKHVA
jgi:hypothetical protein